MRSEFLQCTLRAIAIALPGCCPALHMAVPIDASSLSLALCVLVVVVVVLVVVVVAVLLSRWWFITKATGPTQ